MASEVPLMYGMVIELLCYLFALVKVLLLLCSTHPIAVAPSCSPSGRLCWLTRTGSTPDAPRLLVLLLVCPQVLSSHTLLALFAAIVGGLYLCCARWVYVVSYTGCASLVACE